MPVAKDNKGAAGGTEQRDNVQRVKIKGRGEPVENQRIGEITVSTDANGQVCRVDFGGADTEAE